MPTRDELVETANALRAKLEPAFSPDTALPGTAGGPCSAGHCAAVALLLTQTLGAEILSTIVEGQSHWFNRLEVPDGYIEIDLTGDQFGLPPVQVSLVGRSLYPSHRSREPSEATAETRARARLLAQRAGLTLPPQSVSSRGGTQ